MRRLMTKLLACCLVFALALTMCAGVFSVSAASTGTLTVGEVTVNRGAATAVVPVELATDDANGYAMATYTIVVPAALQTITDIAVSCDSETNPAVVSYLDAEGNVVSVAAGANSATAPAIDAAGNINFKVDCTDIELAGPTSIVVNITFDVSALGGTATLSDVYDITVAEVVAGDYNAEYVDVTADEGSVTVNNLIVTASNGNFASDFSLLFAVNKDMVDTFGVVLEAVTANGTQTFTADDANGTTTAKGEKCYVYYVKGISARQVADAVTVTLKADDYVGGSMNYNLVDYAMAIINKATATELNKKAMAAFLEYAAAAQVNFDYNTENLADANVPAELKNATSVTLADESLPVNSTKTAYISNFNVAYTAQVEMIAAAKGAVPASAQMKFAYKNGEDIETIDFVQQGTMYVATCRSISIRNMVKVLEISIVDGSEVLDTNEFSFLSYAYKTDVNAKKEGATQKTKNNAANALALVKFAKAFALYKGDAVAF